MKLLTVLMLTALPLLCSAGSGCSLLEGVINKTVDADVLVDEYVEYLKPFIAGESTETAIREFKECFLSQDQDTLDGVSSMMEAIYNSIWCAKY